jgi:hypothetical protein
LGVAVGCGVAVGEGKAVADGSAVTVSVKPGGDVTVSMGVSEGVGRIPHCCSNNESNEVPINFKNWRRCIGVFIMIITKT